MTDDAEKTFEATPQRIEKAKREGNIARSSELSSNVAFAAAAVAVAGVVPWLYVTARDALVVAASGAVPWPSVAATIAVALVPVGAAGAGAIVASFVQAGGLHVGAVQARSERLNPIDGIKRMASRETLAHAARAAAAFALASAAMIPTLSAAVCGMVGAGTVPAMAAVAWHGVEGIAGAACGTGLVLALAEYAVARGSWLRKLRMSLEERKREAKEHDGNPLARSRRRALHRSFLRGAIAKVKDASFVVTNPTHVAVALEYRPPAVAVPRVLVRAAGEMAFRARALAREHNIPVIENAPLAQSLFRGLRAGQTIARAHYVAIAEIVIALGRIESDAEVRS